MEKQGALVPFRINIIVGHRGTGKTHWLKLIQDYYQKKQLYALFYDLDQEIEKHTKKTVSELFSQGEKFFRKWEKKIFSNLIDSIPPNKTCFLSVGAGFTCQTKPSWNIIHICRYSDKIGRIFLNKPRLKPFLNPLDEYKKFYKKRQLYYLKQADETLFRREHFKTLEVSDLLFLGFKKLTRPYFTLRLNPQNVPKNTEKLKFFLKKRLNWGLRFFELNDETANLQFVKKITAFVPQNKLLFSSQRSHDFCSLNNKKNWSWDLSLGPPPRGANILTIHQRNKKELKTLLKEFSTYKNYHLKLAVEIFNLKELAIAHKWQNEEIKNRSFLPRSKDGSWLWYRQIFGPQMLLHFIREQENYSQLPQNKNFRAPDQPFLSEAIPFITAKKALAGILGDPVQHSATPKEQDHFFYKQKSIPVLHIPLKETDMTKENLQIFKSLGFVFFAVTSPLKKHAFLCAKICDKTSKKFKASNTLIKQNSIWKAFNTDWEGMKILKKYSSKTTVVWGGGGIRTVLQKCMPLSQFYSARLGTPIKNKIHSNKKQKLFSPKTLIWAVPRNRMKQNCLMPPQNWKPSQVIDINYTDDSPGLEYALQIQAKYKNGLECFKKQARQQRVLFSTNFRRKEKDTNPV